MTTSHKTSTFYLNGLNDLQKPIKQLNYTSASSEDIQKLLNIDPLFKSLGNNNMDLYRKFISKTIESTKYFNYYNPKLSYNIPNLQNVDLSTVEGLEKKYDLEDNQDLFNE